MKPALIFRGQGKRISEVEKRSWDQRVSVFFQKNAWADRAFVNKWARQDFLPFLAEHLPGQETLGFCDNLDAHTTPEFRDILREGNCFRSLLPPECTNYVQAVDAGEGRNLKVLVNQAFQRWLEDDTNLDKWENGTFTAREKRILITHWVGEAWEKLFSEGRNADIYFQKTGLLLTLDGSEDSLINIQGMSDFKVPPVPSLELEIAANASLVADPEVPPPLVEPDSIDDDEDEQEQMEQLEAVLEDELEHDDDIEFVNF